MKLKLTASFKPSTLKNWLLLDAILLAFLGQLVTSQRQFFQGLAYYLSSAVLLLLNFLFTGWGRSVRKQVNRPPTLITPRVSRWLFLIITMLALGLRLYQINTIPYGIDEDESRWLATAYHHFVKKDFQGEYGPWVKYLPIGFGQIQIANFLLGSGLISGRLAAVFSTFIALIIFYFLVKAIFNRRLALIALSFLSLSWVDLSTSRVIILDNLVKPMVVGSYLCLVLGLKKENKLLFLASGLFLALGLLTFINFYLTPFIVLGYLFFYGLFVKKQKLKKLLAWGLLVLIPVIIVLPEAHAYFKLRFPEKSHNLRSASSLPPYLMKNSRALAKGIFYQLDYQLQDMSYPSHTKPYEANWLMPLAFLGLTFSLLHLGKSLWGFPAFWFLGQLLPFPVFLGYFGSRIILPAWPALMIFASLGIYFLFHLTRRLLRIPPGVALMVFMLLALFLATSNYRYYLEQLVVFPNENSRSVRRDLYQVLPQKVNQGYFPILVYQNPPPAYISLYAERYNFDFILSQSQARDYAYELIPNNLLLQKLKTQACRPVTIIFSKQEVGLPSSPIIPAPQTLLRRYYPEIKLEPHPRLLIFNLDEPAACLRFRPAH